MASEVHVYGELAATGVDLPAGQSDFWTTSGINYGQMLWYVAHPLAGPPWDKDLEITHLSFDVDATGNRVAFIEVHNNSATDYASYGLFLFWTDVPS